MMPDVIQMAFGISTRKNPVWRIIKQGGIVECEYYVMRCMRDITLSSNRTINEVTEGSTSTYSQDDLDVVRTEWAEFVNEYIFCSQSQSIGVSLLQIWVLMTQVLRHKDFQRHNFCVIEATVKKGYLTTL
uniref:Uncharacterized protein n=1 Tax=Cucumis melo TaxID=3656 RepID=A0A9I9EL99_CUCME